MKAFQKHKDESGFVLVTTLLILVTLTFIGIGATRNSIVEVKIAGNDRIAKELFYDAESAAMEGGGRMNNEDDPEELIAKRTSKPWLIGKENNGSDPVGPEHLETTWKDSAFTNTLVSGIDEGDQRIKLSVVDHGIMKGAEASSLKVTASSVHGYHLFGYASGNNGWKLIEIGYRKRF